MGAIETETMMLGVVGAGIVLVWAMLLWKIWEERRWRAEVIQANLAELRAMLERWQKQQAEIAGAVEWLQRREQAKLSTADSGEAGLATGVSRAAERPESAPEPRSNGALVRAAASRGMSPNPVPDLGWTGRCIRCATVVRADHRVAYCAPCHRAWVAEGKPETPERYCARCGRPAEGITIRRMRCERCEAGRSREPGAERRAASRAETAAGRVLGRT